MVINVFLQKTKMITCCNCLPKGTGVCISGINEGKSCTQESHCNNTDPSVYVCQAQMPECSGGWYADTPGLVSGCIASGRWYTMATTNPAGRAKQECAKIYANIGNSYYQCDYGGGGGHPDGDSFVYSCINGYKCIPPKNKNDNML